MSRPNRRLRSAFLLAASLLSGAQGARAASLFWSADGANLGGTGTWDTTNLDWSDGLGGWVTWTNATPDDATFDTTAGTVTLGEPITAGTVYFQVDGYTLTGSTLTLLNGIDATNGTSTINSAIVLSGTNTWTAGTGKTLTIGGTVNNSGFGLTITGSGNTSVGGAITGSGSLTKSGNGTLTLSGANTYSGGTTVSAGSLIGTTTSLQGAITNNAAVTFDQSTNGTYAGLMSGTGSLTKSGTGAVTLSGANTYSGGTTVSAGSLIGDATSLQGAITNNAAVTFDQGSTGTYAGLMSGTGSLTKLGTGTLTLSGANTYSGNTTVTAGTVKVGNKNAFGAFDAPRSVARVTVSSGATIDFNGIADAVYGYTISGTGVGGAGALVNTGAAIGTGSAQTTNLKLAGDASVGGTGNWALLGASYAATSLDLGAFTLTKVGSNTLSLVNTTATAGSIQVSGGYVASLASYTTNLSAVAVTLGNVASSGLTVNGPMSVGSLAGGGATGGAISIASGVALTVGALNTSTSYAGAIGGSGSLTKTGAGTLTLSGANTFTGGITVSEGTLKGGVSGAFGSNAISVASGATVDLFANSSATTLTYANAFTGAGTIKVNTNYSAAATTTIVNGLSGFTGTVQVLNSGSNADKLAITGALTTAATVQISSGSTLYTTAAATFGSIVVGGSGSTEGRGALRLGANLTGPVTLTSSSLFSFEGYTLAGNIAIGGGATGAQTLSLGGTGGTTGTLSGIISNGTGTLSLTNLLGTQTLSNANTYSGGTTVTGGVLVATNASGFGTGTVSVGAAGKASINGNLTVANAFAVTNGGIIRTADTGSTNSVTLSGVISGSGAVTIEGNGDTSDSGGGVGGGIYLTGANTFTGPLILTSGVLDVTANLGSASVIVLNGGGLVDRGSNTNVSRAIEVGSAGYLRRYGAVTNSIYSGTFSTYRATGQSAIRTTDGGTQKLTGSGAGYFGSVYVARGTLELSGADWSRASFLTDASASATNITFNSGATTTISSIVKGDKDIVVNAASTLDILQGLYWTSTGASWVKNATTAGSLTSSSGTLTVANGSFTGNITTGDQQINTLVIKDASTIQRTGLVKRNQNNLILTGSNTYTGGTSILGGQLTFNSGALASAGFVTIGQGGALVATGASTDIATWLSGGRISTGSTGTLLVNAATSAAASAAGYSNLWIGSTGAYTYSGALTVGESGFRFGSLANTNTLTVSSALTGGSALTLRGNTTGGLTLTAANTYSGGTTVNGGVLTLDFGTIAGTDNILQSGSRVTLNGSQLWGGTLALVGKAATVNNQALGNLTLAAGSTSSLTSTIGTGGTVNLTLASVTRNTGSFLAITKPATGNITFTGGALGLITSSTGAAYATVGGTDWAALDASGNVVAATYTDSATAGTVTLTANANLTAGTAGTYTLGANSTPSSVRITSAGHTLALTTFNLATSGILTNQAVTISGTTGVLTPSVAGGELVFSNSANATISAIIANNGRASTFTKVGAGQLTINNANTLSGTYYINQGSVLTGNTNAFGNANVVVGAGATLTIANSTSLGGSGTITLRDGAMVQHLAANAVGTLSRNIVLASTGSRAFIGNFSNGNGSLTTSTISGTGDVLLGNWSNANGGIFRTGWRTNTYAGQTYVTANGSNTIQFDNNSVAPADGDVVTPFGASTNPSALLYNGVILFSNSSTANNWYLDNALTLDATGAYAAANVTLAFSDSNAHLRKALTVQQAGTNTATLQLSYSNKNVYLDGGLAGSGILHVTAANSTGSTLYLNAEGSFSGVLSLDQSTYAPYLYLGQNKAAQNAVIALTGAATRLYLNTNLAVIGGLSGVAGADVSANGGALRSLTVNTNANTTFAGTIGANGNNLSLVKAGTGTLALGGANTYVGSTTVQGGTLTLDFNVPGAPTTNILASTSTVALAAGSTLRLNGAGAANNAQTLGALELTGGSTIALAANTGGTMTLNTGVIRRAAGATVNFSAVPSASNLVNVTGITPGLLGAWATAGSGTSQTYLTADAAGLLSAVSTAAYTSPSSTALLTGATVAQWVNNGGVGTAGSYSYQTDTLGTLAGASSINLLRTVNTTAQVLSLGDTLGWNLTANGILAAGTADITVQTGTAANTIVIGSSRELVVSGSGNVTLAAPIANNAGGASSLIYGGTGTLTLTGANSFTGNLIVNSGTVVSGNITNAVWLNNYLGAAAAINRGGTLRITGISNTGMSTVINVNGGGTLEFATAYTVGGTGSAYIGTLNLNSDNGAAASVTGIGAFRIGYNGNTTINSSGSVANTIAAAISMPYAASRTFTINTAEGNTLNITGNVHEYTALAGQVITKTGLGTLVLANSTNGFTAGGLAINAGTLTIGVGGRINSGSYGGTVAVSSGATFVYDSTAAQTLSGVISGAGNVVKSGAGALTLSANNTFTGSLTVSQGTTTIDAAGNYWSFSGSGIAINGPSTLTINSTNRYDIGGKTFTFDSVGGGTLNYNGAGNHVFTANNTYVTNGGARVTVGGTGSINVNGTTATFNVARGTDAWADLVLSTYIWNTTSKLTKQGAGTLALTKQNTYGGATTINGGTLLIDFNQTGAVASNILSSTSALTLGGGDLSLVGKLATVNAQTVNGLSVAAGGGNLRLDTNLATSLSLSVGAISRSVGGALNIVQNATPGAASGVITSSTNTSGILGGWATVNGTDWAVANASSGITAYSAYTNDTWAAGNNVTVTTSSAPTTGSTAYSLRFNAAAANTVTLAGTNTLTSGGILVTGNVGANTTTITGGTLVGSNTGDLVIHQHNTLGGLTIASVIANNTGATGITKTGAGTATITTNTTSTGAINVLAGTLVGQGSNSATGAFGTASAVTVYTGATLQAGNGDNGLFGYTIGSQVVTLNSGATLYAASGSYTYHLPAIVLNGGTMLAVGSNTTYGVWNLDKGVSTGGLGTTSYITGGNISLVQPSGTVFNIGTGDTLNISANIGNHSAVTSTGLTKTGTGTLILSTPNVVSPNFGTKTIEVQNGSMVLAAGPANRLGAGANVTLGNGTNSGKLVLGDANGAAVQSINTLAIAGTGTTNAIVGGSSAISTLTLGLTANTSYTGYLGGGGTNENNLAVAYTGAGILTLSAASTYTGGTTISAGGITYGASNILADTGAVTISGGALALATFNDTIGALTLTGGGITGTGTLTTSSVRVSSGSAISIAANLAGTGGLYKEGAGTLTLGGTNSYTGTTTVAAGGLTLSASAAFSGSIVNAGTVTASSTSFQGVTNSGTFTANSATSLGAVTNTAGTFSATAATTLGTINLTGGTLSLGTSVTATSLNKTGGTLNLGTAGTAGTLNLTAASVIGGNLGFDLSTAIASGNDKIASTAAVSLAGLGTVTVTAINGYLASGSYSLISSSGLTNVGALTLAGQPTGTRQTYALSTSTVANTLTLDVTGNVGQLTFANGAGVTGSAASTGTWSTSASDAVWSNAGAADIFYQGDRVTFGDLSGVSAQTVALSGTLTPGDVAFSNTAATTYTLNGSGLVNGTTALSVSGGGRVVLGNTGGNSFTGATTVTSGTLEAGAANALSTGSAITINGAGAALDVAAVASVAAGTVNLVSGTLAGTTGTLNATTLNASGGTIAANLAGTGILNVTAGTVTLAGTASHTGGTNVTGGTLSVTGVLGGAAVISSGATLNFSGSTDRTYAGNASGAGAITKTGTSVLTLSGTNSAASLTVSTGTVKASSAGALGAMNLTLASGTTLQAATSGTSSGTMTLTGGATLQVDSGITLTRSAGTALAGGQTLTKTGAGILAFNSYISGGFGASTLNVNEGTVQFNTGRFNTNIGLSAINIASGATVSVGGAHYLGGYNATTPTVTITGGTLNFGAEQYMNAINLADGATVGGGGGARTDLTFQLNATSGTSNWNAYLQFVTANINISVSSGATLNLNGNITGGGVLNKTGAGLLAIGATPTNAVTATNISAGTLSAYSVSDVAATAGSIGTGTLTLTGGTLKYLGSGTETTARTLNINTGAATIEVANAGAGVTFSSTAGAISSAFTKAGAGSLTLADDLTLGANSLTVSAGTLNAGGAVTLGGISVTGGTLNITGAVTDSGSISVVGGTLNTSSTATFTGLTLGGTFNHSSSSYGGSGSIAMSGNGTLNLSNAAAAGEHTTLSGTGNLTKSGAGALTLTGSSTLVGDLAVTGGSLALTGAGSLSHDGVVSVSSGATLTIGASVNDSKTGAVTSAGTVSNAGVTARGFVNSGSLTNSGTISGTVGNTSTLANTGTLAGAVTNSGTFTSSGTLGSTVANSGTFTNTGTIAGTVTSSAGTFTSIGQSIAGVTTTGGALNLSGTAGALSVSATAFNVASSTTTGALTASSLAISGAGTVIDFDLADPTNASFYDRISVTGGLDLTNLGDTVTIRLFSLDRVAGTRAAAATSFNPYSSFTLDLISFGSITGVDASGQFTGALGSSPAFLLDDSAFLARNDTHSGSFQLVYGANAYQLVYTAVVPTTEINLSVAGVLADSANGPTFLSTLIPGDAAGQKVQLLRKTGVGALTITEALDHIGGTEILGGSIILSAGASTTGALGTGAVAIGTGTTLQVDVATTLENNFSGAGTLLKTASGDVTLTGTVGLAGTVQVAAGKLSGKFSGVAGTLQVDSGATADFTDATSTFTGALTGAGTALLASGNTLTIGSASNAFTGTFSVTNGTLVLSANSALDAATIDVGASGTAVVSGSGITLGGTYTGTGAFRKTGAGTVTFTGTVASGLSASVDAGTLRGDFTTSLGAVTVASGANLEFAAAADTTRAGSNITGAGSFTKTGNGKLTLSSATGVTGGVNVNAGTLAAADFGTASTVTIASGAVAQLDLASSATLATTFAGAGTLTKAGNSTLTVGSSGLSTFAGKIRVTEGTVATAAIANLGVAPALATANAIQLDGGALAVTATGQTIGLTRGITVGAAGGTLDFSSLGSSGTLTVNSAITGTGSLTLKSAGNTSATGGSDSTLGIHLANTASDFTGDVVITSGLVTYASNAAFGNAANKIVINGGGLLAAVTGRDISREIQVLAGGATLRSYNGTSSTYSGALTGSGAVNRTDAGTLTFTGDLSGYTGTFSNLSSTVTYFTGASAGFGAATINITASTVGFAADRMGSATVNLDGGTLRFESTGSQAGSVKLVSGKTGYVNTNGYNATLANGITGSGTTLEKSGAGTLTLQGSGSATLSTNINAYGGTLEFAGQTTTTAYGWVSGGTLKVSGGTLTASANLMIGSGTLEIAGGTTNITFFRTSEGAGTNSTINHTGGTLNITGTTIENERSNSFMLNHWSGTSTYNLSGGTLNVLGTNMNMGWDGNAYVNQSGGTVNTRGVNFSTGRSNTGAYNLTGGRLNIGVGGFTAATNKTFTAGNATIGALADYTGATALTLSDASAGTTFNTLDSADGATARAITWSGVIGGTGKLVKAGAGALKLSAANTFTGGIEITGGSLELSGTGTLGSGTYAGAIANTGGTFLQSSSAAQTLSGVISGSGTLAKSGSGVLTLSGANTFTGAINLTGGTLNFNSTGLGSTSGITAGAATLQWASGNTQDISALLTLTAGLTTTLDTNGNDVALSAFGGGVSGNIAKAGTGVLTLASGSSFTKGVQVTAGTLSVSDINDGTTSGVGGFLDAASSYVAVKNATLRYTGAGAQSTSRYLWVNQGTATFDITQATGSLTFTATGGDLNGYAVTKAGAGSLEIQDLIQGAASVTVNAGTLSLTGTNTYTAGTTLTAGTLRAGSAGAIGAAGAAVSLNGGALTLATDTVLTTKAITLGGNSTITLDRATSGGGLTTTFGTLTSTSGSRTLTFTKGANVTDAASKVIFNGVLSITGTTTTFNVGSDVTVELSGGATGGAQNINMVKSGAGTLIISSDSFGTWDNGNTTLSAGTLELRGLMGDNSQYRAGVTSAANTTLRLARDTNFAFLSTLAVGGDTTIEIGRITSATTSTSHTLSTLSIGASTLTVNRASSITGGGVGGMSFTGATTLTGNATFAVGSDATLTLSGAVGGAGYGLTKSGNGAMTLSAANTYTGGTTVNAGTLTLGVANGLAASGAVNVNNGTLSIGSNAQTVGALSITGGSITGTGAITASSVSANVASSASVSAVLAGSGALTKTGNGTLTLSATNTFSGGTNLNGGRLAFGNGSLGGSGAVSVNGGTLAWSSGNTQDISSRLSGGSSGATLDTNGNNVGLANGMTFGGNLTKAGAGDLTLSGAGSVAGSTSVTDGRLILGHSGAVGSSDINVSGSATVGLGYALTGDSTFSNNFTGLGTVDLATSGAYTLTLSGLAGFGGSVRLSTGTFDATASNWKGNIIFAGGALAGGLSNYTGAVTVSGTTLNASSGLPANVTLAAGGTIDFSGASGSALTTTIQFTGGSLSNASSFTGNLNVVGTNVTVAAGSLGGGTLVLGSGTSVNITGAVGNSVTVTGGSITGGQNLTGAISVNSGTFKIGATSGQVGIDQLNAGATLTVGGGTLDLNDNAATNTINYASGTLANAASFNGTLNVLSSATLTNASGSSLGGASIVVNDTGRLTNDGTVTGSVTVQSGGTLAGSGTFAGTTIETGGVLSPGNSPGVQTFTSSLVLQGGSIWVQQVYNWTADGTLTTGDANGNHVGARAYDTISLSTVSADPLGGSPPQLDLSDAAKIVDGQLVLNPITLRLMTLAQWGHGFGSQPIDGNMVFARDATGNWIPKDFVIATYSGSALIGDAENITSIFTFDTTEFYNATGPRANASDFTIFENVNQYGVTELTLRVVPEPSTYGVILGGLALVAAAVRRRKRKAD